MTEEELKKLFKSKLEQREFEFNPDNWKAMESMLDQKKVRAGGFYWSSVIVILSFGLLVGSLLFIQPISHPEEKNLSNETPAEKTTDPTPSKTKASETNKPTTKQAISSESIAAQENISETHSVSDQAGPSTKSESSSVKNTSGPVDRKAPVPSTSTAAAYAVDMESGIQVPQEEHLLLAYKEPERLEAETLELSEKPVENFTPEALVKFQDKHEFFINAAAVFNGSHSNNTTGLGWMGGISYQYRVSPRLALNTGFSYSVQNNIGLEQQTDSVFFHFGREVVETDRKSHRMEYLEVPLNLSFQITPKHEVGAGVYAARLISVSEEIERTHYHSKGPPETTQNSFEGYNEDFERYDYGLDLMYRFNVHPTLSLGLQFRQGIADITRDVSPGFNKIHKNMNTRITLRYRLF